MKIVWLESATDDFEEAIDWIASKYQQAANNFAQSALWQVNQLGYFPQLGRIGRCQNTRELIIRKSHYIAVYRFDVAITTIQIIAVMHESQQWPESFN